jgi:hypothetical protein
MTVSLEDDDVKVDYGDREMQVAEAEHSRSEAALEKEVCGQRAPSAARLRPSDPAGTSEVAATQLPEVSATQPQLPEVPATQPQLPEVVAEQVRRASEPEDCSRAGGAAPAVPAAPASLKRHREEDASDHRADGRPKGGEVPAAADVPAADGAGEVPMASRIEARAQLSAMDVKAWREAREAELLKRLSGAATSQEAEMLLEASDTKADHLHSSLLDARRAKYLKDFKKQRESAVMDKGKALALDPLHVLNVVPKTKAWPLLQSFHSKNKHVMTLQNCVDLDAQIRVRFAEWKAILVKFYVGSFARKELLLSEKAKVDAELEAARGSDRRPENMDGLEKKKRKLEASLCSLGDFSDSEEKADRMLVNIFSFRKNYGVADVGSFEVRAEAWLQQLHHDVLSETGPEVLADEDPRFDLEAALEEVL